MNRTTCSILDEAKSIIIEHLMNIMINAVLQQNSSAVGIGDVFVSNADIAVTRRYCGPLIAQDTRIKIVEGRHHALEAVLGPNEFVPNGIEIGDGGTSLAIITGPNMRGKGTYGRQCAIVGLFAQITSFVTAAESTRGFETIEQSSLEASVAEDPLLETIRLVDLDRTTPIEALMQLKKMQEEAKQRKD
jgi:DNA mismatch repair ATPase MutS